MTAADAFCEAFPATNLAFHSRDGRRSDLTNASRAVLQHLAQTGPVSIGEAALHLDRAQSVVSEIVAQLEGHGLLERETDPDNGRAGLADPCRPRKAAGGRRCTRPPARRRGHGRPRREHQTGASGRP